jgi:hypothetical protein
MRNTVTLESTFKHQCHSGRPQQYAAKQILCHAFTTAVHSTTLQSCQGKKHKQ